MQAVENCKVSNPINFRSDDMNHFELLIRFDCTDGSRLESAIAVLVIMFSLLISLFNLFFLFLLIGDTDRRFSQHTIY